MDIKEIAGQIQYLAPSKIKTEEPDAKEFAEILDQKITDDKKLMEACKMLESFFIKEILKSANSTNFAEGSFMAPGQSEEMFRDMLNDEYAEMISRGGGMGLADMLYRQLKK